MAISADTSADLITSSVLHNLEKAVDAQMKEFAPSKQANGTNNPTPAPLDASITTMTRTTSPKLVPAPDDPILKEHKTFTDHMLTCRWTAAHGWHTPSIVPHGPLPLAPSCSTLHYATQCFEGMKLYRGRDARLRLFRPRLNAQRMQLSAARVALPAFDADALLALITQLCVFDGPKWLPRARRGYLYVRPALIGSDEACRRAGAARGAAVRHPRRLPRRPWRHVRWIARRQAACEPRGCGACVAGRVWAC